MSTSSSDQDQKDKSKKDDDCNDDGASDNDVSGQYWFLSTLSPLLAGTFGPMASAFSICALVMNWREYIPPGSTEDTAINLTDPHWLIAINAISLASALIGNLSLLLNMARRLRFSVAQPITICGFYLASVLLIADMAALTSHTGYLIDYAPAIPPENHALTSAFYYAIFAAALYFIIATFMCGTVYGANKGYYERNFRLTTSQRTLMLQTMSFFVYLLLGALIWSKIEGWGYLDSVYWANVTLLTVGLGDITPKTPTGQGLVFPFAIGGILIVGLVVGSIRSLVLERGEEKMAARIIEKRRSTAVNNVDVGHQTIRIGLFAKASFVVHPGMLPAQRREEEFRVMRNLQVIAERERRYMALLGSTLLVSFLWLVGAVVFQKAETVQDLDYLNWVFFAFTSLTTIGYGTPAPESNSGRAFFVLWSLLAVPSLTILISNMGDTVVKGVSELTDFIGSVTVLPGDRGITATLKLMMQRLRPVLTTSRWTGPGVFGDYPKDSNEKAMQSKTKAWENRVLDRLADRVSIHISAEELEKESEEVANNLPMTDELECDITFYHYVLSRECRNVAKHMADDPPKKYNWGDWEYYIRLMGNETPDTAAKAFPDQDIPNTLVPERFMAVFDRARTTTSYDSPHLRHTSQSDLLDLQQTHTWTMPWSWLSDDSPLMDKKSESQWIHERLSAALERELNRTRLGFKRRPPISYRRLRQHARAKYGKSKQGQNGEKTNDKSTQNDNSPAEEDATLPLEDDDQDTIDDLNGDENKVARENLERAVLGAD